jgi:hypothetical protein
VDMGAVVSVVKAKDAAVLHCHSAAVEVLEVGLVVSTVFVVELVPFVVGLCVDCSWISKRLGTSAWEA